MKQLRVYLDTSIISFMDAGDAPEKRQATEEFFEFYVKLGLYDIFISDLVVAELEATRDTVKRKRLLNILNSYPIDYVQIQESEEIKFLTALYIQKGIMPANKEADALHVAISTVNEIDVLLSWNYHHLANVVRERRIVAENALHNYWHNLRILTPFELIGLRDEN